MELAWKPSGSFLLSFHFFVFLSYCLSVSLSLRFSVFVGLSSSLVHLSSLELTWTRSGSFLLSFHIFAFLSYCLIAFLSLCLFCLNSSFTILQSIGQIRNASSSNKERGRDGWLLLGNVHVGDKAIESKRLREQVRMRDQKHWSRGGHELILKGKKLEIDKSEIFFGDCPLKRQPQSDRYSHPPPKCNMSQYLLSDSQITDRRRD